MGLLHLCIPGVQHVLSSVWVCRGGTKRNSKRHLQRHQGLETEACALPAGQAGSAPGRSQTRKEAQTLHAGCYQLQGEVGRCQWQSQKRGSHTCRQRNRSAALEANQQPRDPTPQTRGRALQGWSRPLPAGGPGPAKKGSWQVSRFSRFTLYPRDAVFQSLCWGRPAVSRGPPSVSLCPWA